MTEKQGPLHRLSTLDMGEGGPIAADELSTLARRYAAEGMFDEAIHLYEMALRQQPASAALEVNLTRVKDLRRNFELERDRTIRAEIITEHDRNELDASQYLGLAQYYMDIDQSTKAIELLEIAKLRTPNNYRPYDMLGRLYFSIGEWELAHAEIRRARKLNPFDRALAEISGRLNFELKHYDDAIFDFVSAFLLSADRRGESGESIRRMIRTLKRMQGLDNPTLQARVKEQLGELALFAERLEFRKENLFQMESRAVVTEILQKITRDQEKRGTLITLSAELRQIPAFHHLRDEQILGLARFASIEKIGSGEYLFREGDRSMNFYVIRDGELEVRKETLLGAHIFARLGPGQIVGEMNFLDRQFRSADARAASDVTCYTFAFSALDQIAEQDREAAVGLHWAFWQSLAEKVRLANEQIKSFFPDAPNLSREALPHDEPESAEISVTNKVDLFEERGLTAAEMKLLATFSSEERYRGGRAVFREGERGETLYIVVEGRIRISKYVPGAGEEALAILGRGDFFGEMALIDDQPRSADAWVHTGEATVLAIDRATLQEVLSMDPAASLQFLSLLCRLISRRLRQIDEKLAQWKVLAGHF
jgi:CRP/FNR family transcriptional regulator, cyclic AMP receptor protein